jgi:hypothetical protein
MYLGGPQKHILLTNRVKQPVKEDGSRVEENWTQQNRQFSSI